MVEDGIRPTAKWANRMLRPLTSVYRRLEKHQETLSFIATTSLRQKEDNINSKNKSSTHYNNNYYLATRARHAERTATLPRVAGVEDGYSYSECDEDDPSWVPGRLDKRRSRVRHKYSTRCGREEGRRGGRRRNRLSIGSPETQRTLPGAVEVATPLITGKVAPRATSDERPFPARFPAAAAANNNIPEPSYVRKTGRSRENSHCSFDKNSWNEALDLSGDARFIDIARFLDRILVKFLENTGVCSTDSFCKDRGARSLLSMVVRSLPEFIEDEQEMQNGLDEELDVNMCEVYLTELEAEYAPNGQGWIPLREAVRSQGIHLVSEMLRKGLVTKIVGRRLLELCLIHKHFDAFETILSKYLTTIQTQDYPISFESPQWVDGHDNPVQMLKIYYSTAFGHRSFIFDELARLLVRRAVPPEWMVTISWKPCVDDAIQSISAEDENSAAATSFVEAVILSASGVYTATGASVSTVNRRAVAVMPPSPSPSPPLPPQLPQRETRASAANADTYSSRQDQQSSCPVLMQDALGNLVLSLTAVLCGMHIVRSYAPTGREEKKIAHNTKMKSLIRYLTLVVQRDIEMRPLLWFSEADVPTAPQSLRRGYVLLGNCLLQCVDGPFTSGIGRSDSASVRNLESFCLSLASRQDMVKDLMVLVRQVICLYERGSKHDRTRTSQGVRDQVGQLMKISDLQGLSVLLGKVAVETAMNLAETTLDPDDPAWAAEIQERFVLLQHQRGVKRKSNNNVGVYQHRYVQEEDGDDIVNNNNDDDGDDDVADLYRWEEGIGEWVKRTPAPKTKMKITMPWNLASSSRPKVILSQQQGNRPSPPASSMTSGSSSSSSARATAFPSDNSDNDSASSFTSSAPSTPSVSVGKLRKRGISEEEEEEEDEHNDIPLRPNKRGRRSAAATVSEAASAKSSESENDDHWLNYSKSQTRMMDDSPRTVTGYRVHRSAASDINSVETSTTTTDADSDIDSDTREVTTGAKEAKSQSSTGARKRTATSTANGIEAVIANNKKKTATILPVADETSNITTAGGGTVSDSSQDDYDCLCDSTTTKPVLSSSVSASSSSTGFRMRRRRRGLSLISSVARRRRKSTRPSKTIPCPEGDGDGDGESDDELSFLV